MPNRVLRDWTASETLDLLSAEAEVFFTRLIMKADDYGYFHGNPKLLRSALYPLKEYKDKDILGWRDECRKSGIIQMYLVDGREYLKILNFGQRLRRMVSRFPQPIEHQHVDIPPSIDSQLSDRRRPESESESESETEFETEKKLNPKTTAVEPLVFVWPSFGDFWEAYGKKADKGKCEKKWRKIPQGVREKIMDHVPRYVISTPDVQYRRNPLTYLNNESWNNEILSTNGNHIELNKTAQHVRSLAEDYAKRYSTSSGDG